MAVQFDRGQDINTKISATGSAFSAAVTGVNAAQRLGSALSSLSSFNSVGSAIRSINLPAAGEAIGDLESAFSSFGGDAAAGDWRVRLSLPNWTSFKNSPVLKPLKDAGGLIFPYTPTITIKSSAKYSAEPVVHTNFPFNAFKSSDPGTIDIQAAMNVEDSTQALYWIAALHYLRSVEKMFSGNDSKAGNPPPIVFLNGYGNYVFKNIPVAVTAFSCQLPNDCDYISTEVVGSAAGSVASVADNLGGLAETLGATIDGIAPFTNPLGSALGGIGQVAGLLGAFGIGGTTNGGLAYVPTKSVFSITLTPIYSRTSARKFSLDQFVTGGYLSSGFGYV